MAAAELFLEVATECGPKMDVETFQILSSCRSYKHHNESLVKHMQKLEQRFKSMGDELCDTTEPEDAAIQNTKSQDEESLEKQQNEQAVWSKVMNQNHEERANAKDKATQPKLHQKDLIGDNTSLQKDVTINRHESPSENESGRKIINSQ